MKCRNWIERLPSLLDEPPGSPDRSRLEDHIRHCEGCRSQWVLLNRLKEASKGLDGQVPEDNIWQGIQGELAGQEAETKKKPVPLGPMVRLALGWGAPLSLVIVIAVWMWPRHGAVSIPQTANIPPALTSAEFSEVPADEARRPAPVHAARKRVPSARTKSLPTRMPRYLVEDLAQAEDLSEPEARVQYILPVLESTDFDNSGNGQTYIMPAVCSTAREPF